MQCLEKRQSQRPQTAQEVFNRLDAIAKSNREVVENFVPVTAAELTMIAAAPHSRVGVLLAGAIAVTVAGAAVILSVLRQPESPQRVFMKQRTEQFLGYRTKLCLRERVFVLVIFIVGNPDIALVALRSTGVAFRASRRET